MIIYGSGGVIITGQSIVENLKPIPPKVHLNYAYALADPNIINTPKPKNAVIINNKAVAPTLSANRFAISHQPGWCNFGEVCVGSPFLPKIVQNRQGVYLPPKSGATVISNDQLATASDH